MRTLISSSCQDGLADTSKLMGMWTALSPADQAYFLTDKAPDDEAFCNRMRALLVKAGVPDKDDLMGGGMLVMESTSRTAQLLRDWLSVGAEASSGQ